MRYIRRFTALLLATAIAVEPFGESVLAAEAETSGAGAQVQDLDVAAAEELFADVWDGDLEASVPEQAANEER